MTVIPFRRPVVMLQGRIANGNQQFTRNQAVAISATFFDTSGNVAIPPAATVTLSYWAVSDGCRKHTSYDLTGVAGVWSYTWDSSIAHHGSITGHVASSDKNYSIDFNFRLSLNPANLKTLPAVSVATTVTASFSCHGSSAITFIGRNSTAFFILLHNNSDHILLRRGGGARLLRGH